MKKYRITAIRDIEAESVSLAIKQFLTNPFVKEAPGEVVELETPAPTAEQPTKKSLVSKVADEVKALGKDAVAQVSGSTADPVCPEHQRSMRKGKFGWYCPTRVGS